MNMEQILAGARELGMISWALGEMATPMFSKNLQDYKIEQNIDSLPDTMALYTAWSKGWHTANAQS